MQRSPTAILDREKVHGVIFAISYNPLTVKGKGRELQRCPQMSVSSAAPDRRAETLKSQTTDILQRWSNPTCVSA